jgi:hypothetical protein
VAKASVVSATSINLFMFEKPPKGVARGGEGR